MRIVFKIIFISSNYWFYGRDLFDEKATLYPFGFILMDFWPKKKYVVQS